MEKKTDNLKSLSSRHEYKFLVNDVEKTAILKFIKPFCHTDSQSKNGIYDVNTIYFDDRNLMSYQEKLNGDFEKTKYRLRYYNEDFFNINAEIKHKEGSWSQKYIYKLRVKKGENLKSLLEKNQNSFTQKITVLKMNPTIFVNYKREAYIANLEKDVRITFDSELKFSDCLYSIQGKFLNDYPLKKNILEIKFGQQNYWIMKLLAELKERRVSFSKYYELFKYSHQMSGYELF